MSAAPDAEAPDVLQLQPEVDDQLYLGDARQASIQMDCASMTPLGQGERRVRSTASMGFTSFRSPGS